MVKIMNIIYRNISVVTICVLSLSCSLFSMEKQEQLNVELFQGIAGLKDIKSVQHIKDIIAQGADPRAVIQFDPQVLGSHYTEKTTLDCALLCGRVDLFQCLLECGARPFDSALPYLKSPGEKVISTYPLFKNVLYEYLTNRAKTTTRNKALRVLIKNKDVNNISRVLKNLLDERRRRFVVNKVLDGKTLLHLTLDKYLVDKDPKYKDILRLLINAGAQVDKPNEEGVTPAQIVNQKAPELRDLFSKEPTTEEATA